MTTELITLLDDQKSLLYFILVFSPDHLMRLSLLASRFVCCIFLYASLFAQATSHLLRSDGSDRVTATSFKPELAAQLAASLAQATATSIGLMAAMFSITRTTATFHVMGSGDLLCLEGSDFSPH